MRRVKNTGEGDELKSIKKREGGDRGNSAELTREMQDRCGGRNQAGEERKRTGGRKRAKDAEKTPPRKHK